MRGALRAVGTEGRGAASVGPGVRVVPCGRAGTAMRHFGEPTPGFPVLEAAEVADVVAFLRTLGGEATASQERAP